MTFWDHPDNQEGLRAWHMKRDWNPRCYCGSYAVARLVYILDGGREIGQQRLLCHRHYHASLDTLERLRAAMSIEGISVAVASP